MKLELRRHAWLAISALLLAALLLAGIGGPAAATPPKPVLSGQQGSNISSAADGVEVAAARPWTEAEMRAAKPYPLPEVEAKALTESIESIEKELAAGPAGFIPGALPGEKVAEVANETQLLSISPLVGLLGYTYPPPYTRYEIFTSYTQYPYVTIGKLFFRQLGGSYVCSAASIDKYAIWTAGHCVHAGNNSSTGWSTNVSFVPAYKDGSAPQGTWTAHQLWTKTTWYQYGNPNGLRRDMGGAVMRKSGGKGIGEKVGWLGLAWNGPYEQHWNLFGYPADTPFNGKRLITCQASYAYSLSTGTVGSLTQAVGCDMTGGCSGGPWIWKFGTGNYLNGDNSFRRSGYNNELNSPHFDNEAKSLWDAMHAVTPP